MGTRKAYDAGVFCWVDLMTSDAKGAKDFYAKLFGWTYEDLPTGEGTYTLTHVGDDVTAGLMEMAQQPPHWNSYVAVESADEAAEKAKEAGAGVVFEPVDVGEAGRMATIQDPSGGVVTLWEGRDRHGADLVNAHGAFSWNDLQTHDVDKAVAFYTEALGWEVGEIEGVEDRYAIKAGETLNGGIAKAVGGEEVPPHWLVFFAVDDLDAALQTAGDAGGDVIAGPLDIPAGQMAVVTDPQGAAFGLFAGELDD